MTLNERERRLLVGLAVILTTGALVRLVARNHPELTPGVAGAGAGVGADTTGSTGTAKGGPRAIRSEPGDAAALDSLFADGRLDVNAAGEVHLRMLPGIGPALAGRMVELRRSRGPFAAPEELLMVKGIGPKTLERLRPHIVVR
jgi:competence protein ComEA